MARTPGHPSKNCYDPNCNFVVAQRRQNSEVGCAYVAVDEDEYGKAVIEKWSISFHNVYKGV